MPTIIDAAYDVGGDNAGAIEQPFAHLAVGIAPEQIALIVAVEIGSTGDRPIGQRIYIVQDGIFGDCGTVHKPLSHIASVVLPEDIGGAITIEVIHSFNFPIASGNGYQGSRNSIWAIQK